MIELDHVSFHYDAAAGAHPVLRDVDLRIEAGELVLVAGRTGSGKSTLLRTINGLVPHFTGGHLTGRITVAGEVLGAGRPPRSVAHLVGMVGQDPLAGFVTEIVEEELAYGMEQLGVEPGTMRRRVEETLDLLGIADLRRRPLRSLSGGQQQRVAIGAVLTMHPPVLVLDEPTSALDPTAAEDVLATLARLVHDLGTTVVLAEHRLERVLPFADRMVYVTGDGSVVDGPPADVLRELPVGPPVVELGRLAGWEPLPLTVRDARRRAAALRDQLATAAPAAPDPSIAPSALDARGIVVRHGSTPAVRGVDLRLARGEVVALLGRNGSGKSSLLWALQGSGPRQSGSVLVHTPTGALDPASVDAAGARALVGLVPQTPADLLYLETVALECADADRGASAGTGSTRRLLDQLADGIPDASHPRDLSAGQQLALVLAIQLAAAPSIALLDEPTRGLDYIGKAALARAVALLAADDRAVVVATHDVEFAARIADRALVLADGEIVAEGAAADVLAGSPAFAPQVTKVLGEPWLTVDQVRDALTRAEVPA